MIARLGRRGDGIADTPAGPLYVPYALPGETAEVDAWPGHPDRRRLVRVDAREPGAHRADLPAFRHLRRLRAAASGRGALSRLEARARDRGARAGRASMCRSTISSMRMARAAAAPCSTRAAAPATCSRSGSRRCGRIRWWRSIAARCWRPASTARSRRPGRWRRRSSHARKPLDIQVTATDAGLDIDVRGSGPLTAARAAELAQIAERQRLARLTRHGELVAQRAVPTVSLGRARVALPPGAFLQATAAGEAALGALVTRRMRRSKIADLFAGVGPFALRLAERARVTAVDSDATRSRRSSARPRRRRASSRSRREIRDLFRRPLWRPSSSVSTVWCSTRRGRAPRRRRARSRLRPCRAVVAVSCNPATFARDARILVDGGYRLARVTPVDQFRYSFHVELVARFQPRRRTGVREAPLPRR